MPVEAAKYIQELKPLQPTNLESFADTDNHIRMIKDVLSSTFKNITSEVKLTSLELNHFMDFFWWNETLQSESIGYLEMGPAPGYEITAYEVYFLDYYDLTKTENKMAILDRDTEYVKRMEGLGALGAVIWSVVPPAIMTTEYGDAFAVCNGGSIKGSELHRLYGIENTPAMNSGEAILMETARAGEQGWESHPEEPAYKTRFIHRPFDTDWEQITGLTEKTTHDHGGGLHKHYVTNLFPSFVGGTYYVAEQWLNMASGSAVVASNLRSVNYYYNDSTPDGYTHSHDISYVNLNTETTPSAVFLYAYMRVN